MEFINQSVVVSFKDTKSQVNAFKDMAETQGSILHSNDEEIFSLIGNEKCSVMMGLSSEEKIFLWDLKDLP